jgi:hypothetical protein
VKANVLRSLAPSVFKGSLTKDQQERYDQWKSIENYLDTASTRLRVLLDEAVRSTADNENEAGKQSERKSSGVDDINVIVGSSRGN